MAIIHKLSSGAKTADGIICSKKCWYYGFTCATGGSNRTTILYNATSATGTIVENFVCDGNKTEDGHSHAIPVYCDTGLYLNHSGGGETVIVYFKPVESSSF